MGLDPGLLVAGRREISARLSAAKWRLAALAAGLVAGGLFAAAGFLVLVGTLGAINASMIVGAAFAAAAIGCAARASFLARRRRREAEILRARLTAGFFAAGTGLGRKAGIAAPLLAFAAGVMLARK
jgi:hypothetical protein